MNIGVEQISRVQSESAWRIGRAIVGGSAGSGFVSHTGIVRVQQRF
ncbi:hypothetical protein PHO31112_00720 [Pandoraea horticolens]|uniref:Uncharacterized protein n=1 Tax=Pandoraea horticolens TaxID=2508298 RepID=A0A5E4SG89_9BURK|nr:hypothetical protein [Pandoraea horticolens]VVD73178.1 hypothetical protein PHO31112_00720 [Pandoraea horticolens]